MRFFMAPMVSTLRFAFSVLKVTGHNSIFSKSDLKLVEIEVYLKDCKSLM